MIQKSPVYFILNFDLLISVIVNLARFEVIASARHHFADSNYLISLINEPWYYRLRSGGCACIQVVHKHNGAILYVFLNYADNRAGIS